MASVGQKPAEGMAEVSADDGVAELGGVPVSDAEQVGDVGDDPSHWEVVGRIP